MAKTFFNTNTFDHFLPVADLQVTANPAGVELLVLGAKKPDYAQYTGLKAVYRFGIGTDNIDFDYLNSKNVRICFPSDETKTIIFDATANFAAFACLQLLMGDALGDVNGWKKTQRGYLGFKKVLVMGLGNIGQRVANKLKNFVQVLEYDPAKNAAVDLCKLLGEADCITVHTPLTAETQNFFDAEKLSLVKEGCHFVNTARGAIFNEEALYQKLRTSSSKAFFDVFWVEPYSGKLKDLGPGKFFMTPHTASNTKEFIDAGFQDILTIAKQL